MVKRQTIASTLPAAAIKWPIMLLVLEIGTSISGLAESSLDGESLDRIIDGRAGPVCIDVIDVFGIEPRPFQGLFQASDRPAPFVVAVGDAKGVGRRAVADDFAVNLWHLVPWHARALRGRACRPLRPG